MAKQQNPLKLIDPKEALRIINENHAAELAVSRTRRNELQHQLSNPAAGLKAHVRSCKKGCANRIAIAAGATIARKRFTPSFSAVPASA